jgi:hypothetical protein
LPQARRRALTLAGAVGLVVICGGCASSSPAPAKRTTTTTRGPAPVATPATVHNAGDGLNVTMSAARGAHSAPARTVTFTITASAVHAPGALHYVVAYGDGMTAANVTPLLCQAAPGPPAQETWTLTHTYPVKAKRIYAVTAQIQVTCSSNLAAVTMRVTP